MILVMTMRLRSICFAREMTQRVTGLEGDQNHPMFNRKQIAFEKDWLDERLDFDLAWCMTANPGNDNEIEMPSFGLWIVFNSMVIDKRTIQADLDYLPVITYPPNDSVLKDYLQSLPKIVAKTSVLLGKYLKVPPCPPISKLL